MIGYFNAFFEELKKDFPNAESDSDKDLGFFYVNGDKSTFTIGLKGCEGFIKLTLDGKSFLIEGRFWGTPSDGGEVYRFLRDRYIIPIYKLDTQE